MTKNEYERVKTDERINHAAQYMRIYDKKGFLRLLKEMVDRRNSIAQELANERMSRMAPAEIGAWATAAGRLDEIDDFLHCINKYFINIDIDFETEDGAIDSYERAMINLYDKEKDDDVLV